jgi:integrase
MKKDKRPYGAGSVFREGQGWAIRWRETVIGEDGQPRKVKRYEALGPVSKTEATQRLNERLAPKGAKAVMTFKTQAAQWERDILPMYKYSTRQGHQAILKVHLLPRFGTLPLCDITTDRIQAYVTHLRGKQYSPHSIDHFHEVLSSVLRAAVRWRRLEVNPAEGVILPRITTVRSKWVLTPQEAGALLGCLAPKPRAMVALALISGMRRGELLGVRWKFIDEENAIVRIEEACYQGHFDTPKTEAGRRSLPIAAPVLALIQDWRQRSRRKAPEDLVFGTRHGKPENPNNILRRHIYPACDALKLPRATWLTLRRTFCSWCHASAVPAKVTAELMGHANVSTTLNVYTQVVGDSKRLAIEKLVDEIAWPELGQISEAAKRVTM